MWKGIQRFLSRTSKSRLPETYKTPQTDPGNRYHIRRVGVNATNKRHTITRLRRFLPDLSWQTAEDMVNTAIQEGSALVRVLNSKVSYHIILYKHIYIMNILITLSLPITVYLLYYRYDRMK